MKASLRRIAAILAAGASVLGASQAAAQHMNQDDAPCRDAGTTAGAAACFSRAARDQDTALAALLDRIRPVLDGDELDLLNPAQAAWMEYRRLSCEGEYAMYHGGTGGPVARLACLEALTRSRILHLHSAYDWRIAKYEWTLSHPNER